MQQHEKKGVIMEIKNLSQLKRAIDNGCCFIIQTHYLKPQYTGQIRKPNKIQTNGFYSIVPGEPDNEVTTANAGKGSWFAYGSAREWTFEDGLCKCTHDGRRIWDISIFFENTQPVYAEN